MCCVLITSDNRAVSKEPHVHLAGLRASRVPATAGVAARNRLSPVGRAVCRGLAFPVAAALSGGTVSFGVALSFVLIRPRSSRVSRLGCLVSSRCGPVSAGVGGGLPALQGHPAPRHQGREHRHRRGLHHQAHRLWLRGLPGAGPAVLHLLRDH